MSFLSKLFRKDNGTGATTRNGYLDSHGYYLAMEKKRSVFANNHSAPQLPYAVADIIMNKIDKDMACCVRWDIMTYRWALHTFKRTSSCRIAMRKKSESGHRHFVRDGEQTPEQLQSYTQEHLKKFDLVFFDGPGKRDEVELVLPMLKDNAVVLMSDDFNDGYDFDSALAKFQAAGFKALTISNPAPVFHELTTAILYRADNFLGL